MNLAGLLQKWMISGPLYIKLRADRLWIKNMQTGKFIEERPVLALENATPKTVGRFGTRSTRKISSSPLAQNGFDHPRSIIADFAIAEKTLKQFYVRVLGDSLFKPSPLVVIQVMEKTEGGLTAVEVRALIELAMGAGAREASIWTGEELNDYQFKKLDFPGNHWLPSVPAWLKTLSR